MRCDIDWGFLHAFSKGRFKMSVLSAEKHMLAAAARLPGDLVMRDIMRCETTASSKSEFIYQPTRNLRLWEAAKSSARGEPRGWLILLTRVVDIRDHYVFSCHYLLLGDVLPATNDILYVTRWPGATLLTCISNPSAELYSVLPKSHLRMVQCCNRCRVACRPPTGSG